MYCYILQHISAESSGSSQASKQPPTREPAIPLLLRSHSYREHFSRRTSDKLIRENYRNNFKLLLWQEERTHERILKEK